MSINLYKEFLLEEEKFLKNLERNLKDQINRLSVEELSILKLISSKDPSQLDDVSNHELLPEDEPLFNSNGTELNSNHDAICDTNNDPVDTHQDEINDTNNGPINDTIDDTINNTTNDKENNTNHEKDGNDKKSVDTPVKLKKIKIEPNVSTENVNTESKVPSKTSKTIEKTENPSSSQVITDNTVPSDKDKNPTIKITNTCTKTNKNEPSTSNSKPRRRKISRRKELSQKLKEMFDDRQNDPVTSLTPDKIKKETITVSPMKTNESGSNYSTSNENNKDIVLDDVVVNEIPLNLDLSFQSEGTQKDVTINVGKDDEVDKSEKIDDVEEEEEEEEDEDEDEDEVGEGVGDMDET